VLPTGEKLTLCLLANITLEVSPFCAYMSFLALLQFFKCILEVVFCEGVQHRLRFCLYHPNCVEIVPVLSSIGETEKLQGAKSGE
jgi:hypothetical protein